MGTMRGPWYVVETGFRKAVVIDATFWNPKPLNEYSWSAVLCSLCCCCFFFEEEEESRLEIEM